MSRDLYALHSLRCIAGLRIQQGSKRRLRSALFIPTVAAAPNRNLGPHSAVDIFCILCGSTLYRSRRTTRLRLRHQLYAALSLRASHHVNWLKFRSILGSALRLLRVSHGFILCPIPSMNFSIHDIIV